MRSLTLYRRLRPRSRQQSHPAYHKILKRFVGRLPPFAHVFPKTWNFRCWIFVDVFEWTLEFGRPVIFAGCPLDDVGFVAFLLLGGGETTGGGRETGGVAEEEAARAEVGRG